MAITGTITKVEVPDEIPVGDEIVVKVNGDLYDPSAGAIDFWSGAFVAKSSEGERDVGLFRGNGSKIGPEWFAPISLHLGTMPNRSVSIEVRLYGNDAYWADWHWGVWPDYPK